MTFIISSRNILFSGGSFVNTARAGDPTYHTGIHTARSTIVIQDDQTTPAQDTTTILLRSGITAAPVCRFYARLYSLGGAAFAALYGRDYITQAFTRVITTPVAVPYPSGNVAPILDLGLFQLDENEEAALRIWGPSGVQLIELDVVVRPDDYDGSSVIDPAAPAFVTASGVNAINGGDPAMTFIYRPFLLYDAPPHPELVIDGSISSESGDFEGFDRTWIPFFAEIYVNGVLSVGDGFNYPFSNGAVSGPDPEPTWELIGGNVFSASPLFAVEPGDEIATRAYGGYNGFGQHSVLTVRRTFLSKCLEGPTVSSGGDTSRTVTYSHPRPGAVESYDARIYYNNNSLPVLKEVVEAGISSDPYVFPRQDPTSYGGDSRYLLAIRANYYDGSWITDAVTYEPTGEALGVFRTRHKAHS